MTRINIRCAFWALAAALGAAAPAAAQVPNVGFVFPTGGQAGAKTTVNISGGNLQGATGLLLSGTGVQAAITNNTNAGALPVELTVAPDAVPGLREIRVVTPRGTSNAGRIWVGSYPDLNETEPNNSVLAGQKVEKLPVTLNGQINGGEDVDNFTFQANAGDTYVFDLVAAQMASGLDGFLTLYDSRRRLLKSEQDAFDRDPRLIYTFKTAGTYTIQVRDSMFRGGGNFTYRLTVGKIPVVTGFLPRGGKRGQTVQVNLQGVNLGAMATMPVQIPMAGEQVTVPLTTPMGPSTNTVSLLAGDVDDVVEAEPNNAPAQANSLSDAPIAVSGRIDKAGDVDVFKIKPAAAGNLSFDLLGRRIGSKIESYLRILGADGKELQANDDADGKDSRIVYSVAANTEYLVEVRSQDRNFGGDMYYRLVIAPPGGPDFKITVTPDELNVGQGGSAAVTATVQRINGFGGPVALRLDNLPAGITSSPAVIPAGAASALFTLSAEAGANPGATNLIKIVGTGTIGDKPVEREAQPIEIYRQPLTQDNQNSQRNTYLLPASVMNAQAYSLNVDQKAVTVKKGQSVKIKVTATRQMGQTAAINLTVAGQPANVNPALNNIAANMNEAEITINVAGNAPEVTQNLVISGNMNNNVQVAPAVTLTIVP